LERRAFRELVIRSERATLEIGGVAVAMKKIFGMLQDVKP
jgi:hypothetical protein